LQAGFFFTSSWARAAVIKVKTQASAKQKIIIFFISWSSHCHVSFLSDEERQAMPALFKMGGKDTGNGRRANAGFGRTALGDRAGPGRT
jgi:hypothetical protein